MPRVIIASADQSTQNYLASFAEFEPFIAYTGEEVIEMMTEDSFDLVLLDESLPVTDGWETLRIIKDEFNGWDEVRVIMLADVYESEKVIKAWSLGADDYLSRSFFFDNVSEFVRYALSDR